MREYLVPPEIDKICRHFRTKTKFKCYILTAGWKAFQRRSRCFDSSIMKVKCTNVSVLALHLLDLLVVFSTKFVTVKQSMEMSCWRVLITVSALSFIPDFPITYRYHFLSVLSSSSINLNDGPMLPYRAHTWSGLLALFVAQYTVFFSSHSRQALSNLLTSSIG